MLGLDEGGAEEDEGIGRARDVCWGAGVGRAVLARAVVCTGLERGLATFAAKEIV